MAVTRGAGRLCLVTGATGYIGGRLVPELLAAGFRVRCLARSPERLRDHPWFADVEVVRGDATDATAVAAAIDGVDVAYYLVHALGSGRDFEDVDRATATTFAEGRATSRSGADRLPRRADPRPGRRPPLAAPALARRGRAASCSTRAVPTAVLRAAVIIGSGSASFEMLRYLTERLPGDGHAALGAATGSSRSRSATCCATSSACADLPPDVNRAFDIGGPDVLTYSDMMQRYARVAGLRRRIIVPVAGALAAAVEPLGRPGDAGAERASRGRWWSRCATRSSATSTTSRSYVPDPPERTDRLRPRGRAGAATDPGRRRRDPLVVGLGRPARRATRCRPTRTGPAAASTPTSASVDVDASPAALWPVIEGIGGEHGWYSFPLAWRLRGLLDRGVGGVGLRRGRRDPNRLMVGESLDFWRVEERRARAAAAAARRDAAARPGLARAARRAARRPHPLPPARRSSTRAAWSGTSTGGSVAPFHGIVFGSMVRNIAGAAAAREAQEARAAS